MRKLAIALSLVGAMGTGTASALGLGEATVRSSLNQPLRAEIELVNVRDLEQNEILPGLATREEFARAEVDRVYFLSDLTFAVSRNEQGNPVVIISSNKPVREPFLNFLVEVIWPSGRLLREYALLIDPPVFSEEAVKPVQPATTAVNALPEIEEIDTAASTQSTSVSPSGVSAPMAESAPAYDGEEYGPTARNETLWNIALKVRPSKSYSPQQMMLAIQDLNPDAFIDGNINKLKSGQILRVPESGDIEARSRTEAVGAVVEQNRAFAEGRPVAVRKIDATARSSQTQTAQSGSAGGAELKIVVPRSDAAESGAHAGGEGATGAVANELAMTLEKLDESASENTELKSRVEDLETQLETLQSLLTLKDDQLVELQRQLGKSSEEIERVLKEAESSLQAGTQGEPADTGDVAGTMTDPAMGDMSSTGEVSSVDGGMTDSDPMAMGDAASGVDSASGIDADSTGADQVEKPVDTGMAEAPVVKPEASAPTSTKPVIKAKDKPVEIPPEPSFVETILNNPLYLGGIGAGALALIIGLILVSRSNARREQEFHESLAQAESSEDDMDIFGGAAIEDETEAEAPEPEKDDPLAEADVYIAYGRLDQAAQVLENAISEEPSRADIRLKLLEVYRDSENAAAFETQYREVEALNDPETLKRAAELKGTLTEGSAEPEISIDDLENELLSGNTGAVATDTQATAEADDDLELDFPDAGVEDVTAERVEQLDEELDLDFDVDDLDLDEGLTLDKRPETAQEVRTEEALVSADELDALDLDLSEDTDELELDLADEASPVAEAAEDELDALDLDLTSDDLSETVDDAEMADLASSLDEDLGLNEDLGLEENAGLEEELTLDEVSESSGDDFGELELESEALDSSDALKDAPQMENDEEAQEALPSDFSMSDLDAELDAEFDTLDFSEEDEAGESKPEAESAMDLEAEADLDLPSNNLESSETELELDADLELDTDLELDADLDMDGDLNLDHPDEAEVELDLTDMDDDLSELALEDTLEDLEADLPEDDSALLTSESLEGGDTVVMPVARPDAEVDVDEDDDFDFLSGTDEAATKLDLARAYIDMGDSEGARDILEEVAIEGNDDQKKEADDLLKSLD
ncbi:Tfp pilus assembly protein FimV [Oleiphilus messinensis]|uniref:Tfp pilus assembly protein FimV n=2 Tax=Oleiphilus messinensis TaxID=141451 RepID=A0A1Y0I9W8_9GAMM|nr:Tfp pilus assembly protein FimV [Oleiphilus messinensis]